MFLLLFLDRELFTSISGKKRKYLEFTKLKCAQAKELYRLSRFTQPTIVHKVLSVSIKCTFLYVY